MLTIYKYSESKYEFDLGGSKEAFMTRTAFGWLLEVSANESWDKSVTFYWVEPTAKAAFKECYRYLRDSGIRHRRRWC